ncbi:MAG: type II toxin-antitoxin system YafQ family toxin [Chromatiaceae bacterium]|nr:type II toxin-antitoxin system YafQ family toxin [Chromatiaceae bacterium]
MLRPSYTKRFEKDVTRSRKRGKDTDKLKTLMRLIIAQQPLPEQVRDHALIGSYQGRRECHIEPDWLLIYKLHADEVIFERTGTHADLF